MDAEKVLLPSHGIQNGRYVIGKEYHVCISYEYDLLGVQRMTKLSVNVVKHPRKMRLFCGDDLIQVTLLVC